MPERKYKILIVEDDSIIAEDLLGYMKDFGYHTLPSAANAEEAMKALKVELPDLILMDVGLEGEIDGIQLAKLIQDKYEVPFIFLTAYHDDKTIERIKSTRPAGYLVKPVDERSLKTSLEVALFNHSQNQSESMGKEGQDARMDIVNNDHFFIKVKQGLQKIFLKDILFFEAYDNYAYVHTDDKKYIVSMPLISIENKLPSKFFIRVHRSFIINIEKIRGMEDDHLIIHEKNIPIGKTFRQDVMRLIKLL